MFIKRSIKKRVLKEMPLCTLEMQQHHKRELFRGKANAEKLLSRMKSFGVEEKSTHKPTLQTHFP